MTEMGAVVVLWAVNPNKCPIRKKKLLYILFENYWRNIPFLVLDRGTNSYRPKVR